MRMFCHQHQTELIVSSENSRLQLQSFYKKYSFKCGFTTAFIHKVHKHVFINISCAQREKEERELVYRHCGTCIFIVEEARNVAF